MNPLSKLLAGLAAVGALSAAPTRADEKPDAPKPGAKPDEKKPEIDPKDVRVGPPPELAELRKAVEDAARKGENVEEIRKQLDALEKALAGKPWVKPKPGEETPSRPPLADPGRLPPPIAFPNPRIQPDAELMQKVQELMLKAALLRPDDPAGAEKLLKEARELMGKAPGGLLLPPPIFDVRPVPAAGRGSRLGIRVEDLTAAAAERLNVPGRRGVLAAEIVPGSPAEKAGLKANDVILEFDGKAVSDPTEFVRTVQTRKPGEKINLVYARDGKKVEAKGIVLADLDNRRGGIDLIPGALDPRILPVPVPVPGVELVPLPLPNAIPPLDPAALPPPIKFPANLAPGKSRSVNVRIQNDAVTIDADEDGVKFVITGTVAGGKVEVSKISVTKDKKTVDAESIEKLPAEFRDSAKSIMDGVKVSGGK